MAPALWSSCADIIKPLIGRDWSRDLNPGLWLVSLCRYYQARQYYTHFLRSNYRRTQHEIIKNSHTALQHLQSAFTLHIVNINIYHIITWVTKNNKIIYRRPRVAVEGTLSCNLSETITGVCSLDKLLSNKFVTGFPPSHVPPDKSHTDQSESSVQVTWSVSTNQRLE